MTVGQFGLVAVLVIDDIVVFQVKGMNTGEVIDDGLLFFNPAADKEFGAGFGRFDGKGHCVCIEAFFHYQSNARYIIKIGLECS